FLREVLGLVTVARQVNQEPVDGLVVGADQLGAGTGTAGTQVAQQALLVGFRHTASDGRSRGPGNCLCVLDERNRRGVGAKWTGNTCSSAPAGGSQAGITRALPEACPVTALQNIRGRRRSPWHGPRRQAAGSCSRRSKASSSRRPRSRAWLRHD